MKLVSPLLQGLNQPIDLKGPQTDFSCVAIKGSEMLLLVSDVIMSRADKKTHSQAKVFAQTCFHRRFFLALPRARSQINCACVNELTSGLRKS